MKCAIMQPTYNPWIGYFDLIDQVDMFIFLDDVQLTKKSWQVRNRIKFSGGEQFLTIPIRKNKSVYNTMINSAIVDDRNSFRNKHLKAIQLAYRKTPYYKEVFAFVYKLIMNDEQVLSEYNINIIINICKKMGIDTQLIKSSNLKNIHGTKDERLASICNSIGCDEYISPKGSADYINKETLGGSFPKNKINLYYHNYKHPEYNQLYGEFLPYMGVFDILFNEGFEKALEIIKTGRLQPIYYEYF